jgi:hypothetical protein
MEVTLIDTTVDNKIAGNNTLTDTKITNNATLKLSLTGGVMSGNINISTANITTSYGAKIYANDTCIIIVSPNLATQLQVCN